MKTKMITKIVLSFLILVLVFNITGIGVVYSNISAQGEENRPIDGRRIVEIIEEAVRNFWEVIRLDRLFDMLINFFRGIWEWAKNVFEEGLRRGRE